MAQVKWWSGSKLLAPEHKNSDWVLQLLMFCSTAAEVKTSSNQSFHAVLASVCFAAD